VADSPRAAGCRGIGRCAARHRCEEIVLLGADERRAHGCSRRQNSNHLAPNELLAGTGLLHLFADGDLVPGADQLRDVIFSGMVGNAAHRYRLAFFFVSCSKRDLEESRGQDRVVVKQLVEIAQPEEQHCRRMLLLYRMILLH